ncbi:uncharacterized protein LOC107870617 isoform X2 [Capsicum annuum]|uniref:uncharacterized protein LOC107870617 isoform X2 n=1 Tax=Capsicum annuum TaxID=4072 RepID=UPI001FB19AD7|nr:uncharacterized protein LOC107870617 isoform X2 [Capsicum annuum]
MQSLSFNFKGGTKLSWRSGVEVSRQQRGNVKIMACVPESESRSSSLSRSQTYALLKQQMDVAAKYEDYKEAARLRDSLKIFEDAEPVLRLRRLVKEAIAEERFEDAARFRDELKNIAPHSLLKCSSDATTLGIRIKVRSVYIEGRSHPSKGLYFFAYRISITNNSDRPVQLLRRHWIITDANGKTENVWGIGVIGEQPVIHPNTGFEYSSACPLGTPSGRMSNVRNSEEKKISIVTRMCRRIEQNKLWNLANYAIIYGYQDSVWNCRC